MSDNPFSHQPSDPNQPSDPRLRGPSNPYAPTAHPGTDTLAVNPDDVDAIRNAHLSHEASVKSIGCLYFVGAFFGVLLGVFYLGAAALGGIGGNEPLPSVFLVGLGAFMLTLGLAQGYIGYGLRHLSPWARTGGIVLSAIGLLGFPIGTLVSAYFLYLLVSHKGEVVFSESYREVIRKTPHIQYKTSIIVWIFLGLLVALIVIGIIAAVAGG